MTVSDDFIIRPPTLDDLDATVALINACGRADIGVEVFTPSSLRRTWTADEFNLATDAWLIVTSDRQVIAYGEFYDAQPPESYEVSGWVHPDYRGRGLGAHLLRTVEGRARQAMLKAPPDVRISLSQGTYAANAGARALLEQMGYRNVRRWQRMSIDMDSPPPAPRLPDGITIRTFDRGREDRAVHQAYEEAMADEWGHPPLTFDEWQHYKIDAEDNFDPTLWFLATDGAEIAGLAICRWERPGEPDEGHVRDVGVRPAWRRRGIALALLQSVFAEFYRRGKRKVGLGVDATSLTGADRLYTKAGMHVVLESLIYEKELRSGKRET
jgi:mycothiol synthase